MADRNWDKELADIDRRLAAVPDAPQAPPTVPVQAARIEPRRADSAPSDAARPAGAARVPALPSAPRTARVRIALLVRVGLIAAAVAALAYWPYPARCGAQLAYYLSLVGVLGVLGLTSAVASWRHRAPLVHVLALAALTAAGVLAAREILPKVGYALPSPEHPASWSCG